jgi:hypothetical protein
MTRPKRDHILRTAIAIRAYSEDPNRDPVSTRPPTEEIDASPWTLVFDCETTTDATQRLRVGFYQLRNDGKLEKEGIFFDPNAISPDEATRLRAYAKLRDIETLTIVVFRSEVFLRYGYTRQGTVVGFNLPFDLSRIAINHGPARRNMRGGFSFELTRNSDDPRVRVKHLSPRAALIDFAKPGEQETARGMRNRGLKIPAYRGHFVDVKTAAAALLSRRFSLEILAAHLGTPTQKHKTDEHGTLTPAYLDYARADVQVTWECYADLSRRYSEHRLKRSIDRLLSEASIGKAYLQEMGIRPFLACDPTFPRERFGEILCAYYGGRAEVRNRRVIREVVYCDFKSMYPTVNALMGLWQFVIAEGMVVEDSTVDTRGFLETITLGDLQRPEVWRKLCTLVRVNSEESIFPVRTDYDCVTYTIGLNHLMAEEPLWFTLADCIVSKLLTGRCPQIDKAQTYRPGPRQSGLEPIRILGKCDFAIDPNSDDFFTRLIDLRDEAKANRDPIEKTLKIIANSTSYGIFIEVTRDDAPKSELLDVFGIDGKCKHVCTKALEQPGRYFHPLLGVLITGAARLMLGIAEMKTDELGLDWAFCDTDSLAIVRPDCISRNAFHRKAKEIVDWFRPLNPYRRPDSILKIEDVNFAMDSKEPEPLYCFAISSKRYALFNLDSRENSILRKASAHGLGHLIDPYEEADAPSGLPKPQVPLSDIGVHRWHHDFWIKIIQAAVDGHPDQVPLDWHPSFSLPAAMRYSASSPQLLTWLDQWNAGKPYNERIRPFGFMLSYAARTGMFGQFPEMSVVDSPRRGRPRKDGVSKPIAPFCRDPSRALRSVFDRITGEPVDSEQLKTYAEALAQYHLSCEDKFSNGQFFDRGRTERRLVVATAFVLIGKEANRIGESGEADPIVNAMQVFRSEASMLVSCRRPRPQPDHCDARTTSLTAPKRSFMLTVG